MSLLTPRRLSADVTALLLAALGTLAGLGMTAAPAAAVARPAGRSHGPVLTAIRAAHHRGYDQVTFQFSGPLPAHRRARYVSRLPARPSGAPVSVAGRARLLLSFTWAGRRERHIGVAARPASRAYALPGVLQVVAAGDHRSSVEFALGLARREPFRMIVRRHAGQIAVDVATPFHTTVVRDYFANTRGVFGAAATKPVGRPVIRPASASRALERLFAGPTQAELARGLRLVTSGATGFSHVTVRDLVARVYLNGHCAAHGATTTIATQIDPTLRQFPWVRWVKIYDPAGSTGQPSGDSDSIPSCLRPSTVSAWTAQLKGPVLIALVLLAALGILVGLVLTALSMLAGLGRRPHPISPSAYRAEQVKAHPVGTGQFEPDVAWPFYPLRQVRADLAQVEAERRARYRRLWHWPCKRAVWILLAPVSIAAIICLLVTGLTTLVLAATFALVAWACAAIATMAFAGAVILLRAVESGWHRLMRADASCPQCYHVTPWPAYRCPGCSRLHRDVRPGRLGLLARRCECGTLLPTMVLRAAWRLEAVCQRCSEPLRAGSAAIRDVRIPIFGDTSAGKTRFLYAALDSLVGSTALAGVPFGFPDEHSESQARIALDLIRSGRDTVKTSLQIPTALTCRLGKGAGRTLLHLFDGAGEQYRSPELHDSLGYLDHGHGLVYVLDPFSIGSVRDRVAGQVASVISLAAAATGDPETAYGEVVTRLRDSGIAARDQRLAVVVSKADLLAAGGLELPVDSAAIAAWLKEMRLHNLVLSAEREFGEARFFAVASLAAGVSGRAHDAGAPVLWLLASRGVRLPVPEPPAPGRAASSRSGPATDHEPDDQPGDQPSETVKAQP
jgi:hypothetical protein